MFSNALAIFLIATFSPVTVSLAEHTTPYAPFPATREPGAIADPAHPSPEPWASRHLGVLRQGPLCSICSGPNAPLDEHRSIQHAERGDRGSGRAGPRQPGGALRSSALTTPGTARPRHLCPRTMVAPREVHATSALAERGPPAIADRDARGPRSPHASCVAPVREGRHGAAMHIRVRSA